MTLPFHRRTLLRDVCIKLRERYLRTYLLSIQSTSMPSCHPRSTIAESKLAYLSEGLHFCVSPFPVSLASKTAPTYARLGVESILTHQPYCIMRSVSSTSPCCYSKYATYPPSHGVVLAHSVTYAPEWPINFGINYHQRNPPSMIPPQRTTKLTSQRHTNDTEERE